ncbi:MAG: NADAR family protein [Planctomycetota bacterium]|nr:NADAR family protein [Planctomycetota bacterium]
MATLKPMHAGQSEPTRRIDYFVGDHAFLSNFHRDSFSDESGRTYPTLEHAYQAAKATNQFDRERILMASTPLKAKQLGASITTAPDWHERRVAVMDHFLRRKFAPGTQMAAKLLATADAHLAEGNNWGDTFWGTVNGEGQNVLGVLLMRIRDELAGTAQALPQADGVELKPGLPTAAHPAGYTPVAAPPTGSSQTHRPGHEA